MDEATVQVQLPSLEWLVLEYSSKGTNEMFVNTYWPTSNANEYVKCILNWE